MYKQAAKMFSEEERQIIRRLVAGKRYSRNLVNLIDSHDLAGVRFVVDRKTASAKLLFESIGSDWSDDRVMAMERRQDEICKLVLLYVSLLRYLEKHDLVISYKPTSTHANIIQFGLGAVNLPSVTWRLGDESLAGLVIEYYDKEIIPCEALRVLVADDFVTKEEQRFRSQQKATWIAIVISIVIGTFSLVASGAGTYFSARDQHNEALQLTAQSAAALRVPSAACGRSGGN